MSGDARGPRQRSRGPFDRTDGALSPRPPHTAKMSPPLPRAPQVCGTVKRLESLNARRELLDSLSTSVAVTPDRVRALGITR
jgi:hypothetical protein